MGILNEMLENIGITGVSEPEVVLRGQKVSSSNVVNEHFSKPGLKQSHRDDSDDVFFNSVFAPPVDKPPVDFSQITIKKASYLPQVNVNEEKSKKRIAELVNFFYSNPLINLNNFQQAQKLLFRYLDNPADIKQKLVMLQEELDKSSSDTDKFGKVIITWSQRSSGLRLSLFRPKFKGCKQLIALKYAKSGPELVVLTCWEGKHKKHELIKSRSERKVHKKTELGSIIFDAKFWHAFNFAGIHLRNYGKTLECLERNRLTLSELIQEINRKDLLKLLQEPLLSNVSIKTDNQETTFLSFRTSASQKVDIKLCSFASSISMVKTD